MESSLEDYEVSFYVSFNGLSFEVYFVWYKYCYPCFLFLSICLEYFFQPLTFSLCRSFVLRWVSCRQHMYKSHFLIQPATLCPLIGALNPFTFKVIMHRYLFIAMFPLCTCVPLSLTLFLHLLKAVHLASLAELVWRRCILLAYFQLGNSLFHCPF